MAVTISLYSHVPKLFANKDVTLTTLKVMLLDNTATFVAANTTVDAVAGAGPTRAKELYGNGWVQGGPTLAGVAITQVAITDATVNDAKLSATDVDVVASGGSITGYNALIYDATGLYPLCFISFGQLQSAGDTTDFKIRFNANGIINWTQ